MKFWDSSAIVPLLLPETETKLCFDLFKNDSEMIVWYLTPTEILSAVYRKIREGKISENCLSPLREKLHILEKNWSEIIPSEVVRQKAHRLLAVHPLRAADSLQLAAALIAFEDRSEGEVFITFDKNLGEAAKREGFKIL